MKIGRRIQVAQLIKNGAGYDEIIKILKVGKNTVTKVDKKLQDFPEAFDYIDKRENTVEDEFKKKAYAKKGGSLKVFKETEYTGYKRKDVER